MSAARNISKISFAVLFSLLFVPLLMTVLGWPGFRSLDGAFEPIHRKDLTAKSWFSGEFQSQWESWYNDTLATRPPLVRTKNQFLYSTFKETSTYVLIGKENQLFAYNYFPAFRGFERKSTAHWRQVGRDLAWLKDTLANHNIPLLFVIAPNKVRYMPENLPDDLMKTPGDSSDQNSALAILEANGIPYLDLNSYFVSLKNETEYPLFPNTGTHWSEYGALIAGQALLEKLEQLLDTSLTRLHFDKNQLVESTMNGDDELALHLNLWEKPQTQSTIFPKAIFDSSNAHLPNPVLISDSYYWGLKNSGVIPHSFSSNQTLWYYNNTNFNQEHGEVDLDELNRWEEILKRDVVIILGTESNLSLMPYGIIEDLKSGL